MPGGVFYSANCNVSGLTTAGGVDDPQQLSAGGASAAFPASQVEGQSHRWAATSQTLHGSTPTLLVSLFPNSPALPPRFLSSPTLPRFFVPISCCQMFLRSACTSWEKCGIIHNVLHNEDSSCHTSQEKTKKKKKLAMIFLFLQKAKSFPLQKDATQVLFLTAIETTFHAGAMQGHNFD